MLKTGFDTLPKAPNSRPIDSVRPTISARPWWSVAEDPVVAWLISAIASVLICAGLADVPARGEDVPAHGEGGPVGQADAESVVAGTVLDRHLGRDEVHLFRLPPGQRPRLLTVEQRGVDLVVDVEADDGTLLAAIQSPGEDRGPETVLIPTEWTAPPVRSLTVRIAAASRAEPPGPYRLWVDRLSADDTPRLAAESAMHEIGTRFRTERSGDDERLDALVATAVDGFRAAGVLPREAAANGLGAALAGSRGRLDEALAYATRALALTDRMTREGVAREGDAGERVARLRAWALATQGGLRLRRGELVEGERILHAAQGAWRALRDRLGVVDAHAGRCLVQHRRGAFEQASRCYRVGLEDARDLDDRALQAVLLSNLGGVRAAIGEPEQALEDHQEALALYRRDGHSRGEAQALNNLGALYRALGEPDRAVASYRRALAVFRQSGDRYWQARTLNNLAFAHHSLGDPRRARILYERALALRRETGDRVGEAITLSNLGQVYLALGEDRDALLAFRDSHRLRTASGNRRGEAAALQMIGTALLARGNHGLALVALERAFAMQSALGNQPRMATVRLRRGEALLGLGRLAEAATQLGKAAERFGHLQDPTSAIASLAALARVAEQQEDLDAAHQYLTRAKGRIESLRARVADPIRRATVLDAQRQVYGLEVALAVERHQRDPIAGHDRQAFALSESARARSLVELLAGRVVGGDLPKALRARLVTAQRRLSARADQARRLRSAGPESLQARAAKEALFTALGDLEAVWSEAHDASPRLASLVAPPPTTAEAVQQGLEPDTLLLVYRLGDARSVLWAITRTRFDTHLLPARGEIEALARTAHRDLSHVDLRTARSDSAARDRLAEMILTPVAQQLTHRRLLVVADGALHYVPFAALRQPPTAEQANGVPLIVHHEVTHLPAAGMVLAPPLPTQAAPEQVAARQSGLRVAVLADPVFERSDPRLPTAAEPGTDLEGDADDAGIASRTHEELTRLVHTRHEAEAIAALAPGQVDLYLGFDAQRSRVVAGALDGYSVLHFATHGWMDTDHPELSALVLSRFDRSGAVREGLLGLHDVYNLDLDAELVILSGCRTALGRELWGEGLIGLTRGFLYAGARNVIASLWSVQDQATAELMVSLYRALIEDGRDPADALGRAQRRMRADPRWRDPAFWAPFVVVGPGH